MGFIPRVTCRRCGRVFSGVRGRCPYCGTRRLKQSDRVPGTTPGENADTPAGQRAVVNTRWQLLFGGILLLAVVLAVIILVSVGLNGAEKVSPTLPPVEGSLPPVATPSPTPTPTPTPTLESITIYYYDKPLADEFTLRVGDVPVSLFVQTWPTTINVEGEVKWSSSDESVATVEQDGNDCKVTAVGSGNCTIKVECFGVSDTAIVRVP